MTKEEEAAAAIAAQQAKVAPAAPATAPLEAEIKTLKEQNEEYKRRLDGMSGSLRKVEEFVTKLTPQAPAAPNKSDKVELLEKELTAMKTKQTETDKRSEIIAATSGLNFFDTDDVVSRMAGQIQQREDGTFFVKRKETLKETGAQVEREVSVSEAVKALAKEKTYLVKTEVKGGIQANGGKGGVNIEVLPKTLKEAQANPNEYWRLKQENPAYLATLK